MTYEDQFGAKKTMATAAGDISYFDVNVLEQSGMGDVSKLPFSIKILLESLLQNLLWFYYLFLVLVQVLVLEE